MQNEASFFLSSLGLVVSSFYLIFTSLLHFAGWQWNDIPDFIESNFATIIATLALSGTLYQAWAAKVQNSNSVRPFIIIGIEQIGYTLTITIKNIGNGPAVFQRFDILQRGTILKRTEVSDRINKYFYPAYVREFFTISKNSGLAAGEDVVIIKIENAAEDRIEENLQKFLKEFLIDIEYTSLYGDTFTNQKPQTLS